MKLISFSDYRSANRMVTLHKMLERELGISNLVKALKAVICKIFPSFLITFKILG